MAKPFIMDHPLIQHKITLLRDKNTGSKEFRELINEIAMLMCYEATRDMPMKTVEVETPICVAKSKVISGRKVAFVPILRAGLACATDCFRLSPRRRSDILVCIEIPIRTSLLNITASCRPTCRNAISLCLTRCLLPAVRPLTRSTSSKSTAAPA